MEILLYSRTKSELEEQFLRNLKLVKNDRNPECVYALPGEAGEGYFSSLAMEGGIVLSSLDMTFRQTRNIRSEVRYFHSEFNYCIEGGGAVEINGSLAEGPVTSGHAQFVCGNQAIGFLQLPANIRIRQISIDLSPLFWRRIEIEPDRRFGRDFFLLDTATCARSARLLDEILGCPYQGHARRLFLEGKTYELLALRLHQLEPAGRAEKRAPLSLPDVRAIHDARRLLDRQLQNPPTLMRLACLVGINDFKLKLGFKQVYGTTVFGYVRQERMRIARNLLERGQYDVSQAAWTVGYESLSSFSRQFKKTYGCNPGECKPK